MKAGNHVKAITILIAIMLLIIIQIVSAGVTNPAPTNLELKKGESGRFKFQIQNTKQAEPVICSAVLEGDSPLIIEFDEEEMAVEGNSIKYFYGTVTPPDDDTRSEGRLKPIEFGQYTQSFCVQCRKGAAAAGAAIQIITCSLPINVNVVEGRTKENMYITPKPIKIIHILIAVIIIILILIILVYLLHFLKKKRFEEKPQTKTKKNKKHNKK